MSMSPTNKDYDKKIFRIWAIVNKLDGRREVTTRELAEEFNVTYRTIQRDIQLLSTAGFPVVTAERGHHAFLEGFSLKRMEISGEEASLLSFLHEIAKTLGSNFEESFKSILKKVLAKECDSPFYFKVPDGMKIDKDFSFVKDMELAIEESRKINLFYVKPDGGKKLKIHPLKIMFFDGFWYLLARIDSKEWIVKLRLDNIRDVDVLDEYFEEPKNLKTLLDESVNIWFSEKRDKKVVLKIDKEAARYFVRKKYFPLQKVIKENRDGSIVVETRVNDYREIIPNIMRWIPEVKVVSPEELRKEIKNTLAKYQAEE